MSFNYFSPPYPTSSSLTFKEERLGCLLVSPFITSLVIGRLQPTDSLLTQQYHIFLSLNKHLNNIRKATAATIHAQPLNPSFTPHLLQTILEAEKQLITDIDVVLRALIRHNVVSKSGDILLRGENRFTLIRANNICRNCGYKGHYPQECSHWSCPICSNPAPLHTAATCPAANSEFVTTVPVPPSFLIPLLPIISNF